MQSSTTSISTSSSPSPLQIKYSHSNGHYMAGDTVDAILTLDVVESICIREFTVNVRCDGKAGWIDIHTDKIFEHSEIYMNEMIQIAEEDCELLKGRHQFSFRALIPDTCPSSFECEYGTVRYGSRVTLRTVDNKLSKFDYFPFSAVARTSLDDICGVRRPFESDDDIDFTICCLPVGTVSLIISAPRTGFLPGDEISVSIQIMNRTRQKLRNCLIQLVQKVQCHAISRYEKVIDRKLRESTIDAMPLDSVKARSNRQFLSCPMRLPLRTLPSFDGIIDISYVLRFTAVPGIETEIPIVIATFDPKRKRIDDLLLSPKNGRPYVVAPTKNNKKSNNYDDEVIYC